MTEPAGPQRRAIWIMIGATAATCLGVSAIDATFSHLRPIRIVPVVPPPPPDWFTNFIIQSTYWATVFLLTPLIILLARRLRLDRAGGYVRFPLHVVAAAAFSVSVHAVYQVTRWLFFGQALWGTAFWNLNQMYFSVMFACYWLIVAGFYAFDYYRKYQARELQTVRLQEGLIAARLQVLQAQLNPHFLFNALNTVSALAIEGRTDAVVETLGRLGDILRGALADNASHEVPLPQEMELVDAYLEIERLRFSDRLTVETRVSPAARDALLPPMILQPIVENAVVHGICASMWPGRIQIVADRENDAVRLTVTDTGPGFPENAAFQEGVGLGNTRARLAQLYGAAQTLTIENLHPRGALVTMTIPWRSAR